MGILQTLFSWPNGIVVGNLLASVIWAPIAMIRIDRMLKRHHDHMLRHLSGHSVKESADSPVGQVVRPE